MNSRAIDKRKNKGLNQTCGCAAFWKIKLEVSLIHNKVYGIKKL
jgi:hypothetical protein